MDSGAEGSWLIERETGSQKGGFVKQPDQVLDGSFGGISISSSLQFDDDRVVWVQFEGLLGNHVRGHGRISQSLGLHDSFHISGPAPFGGGQDARRLAHSSTDEDLLDLVTEDFLDEGAETFEGSLLLFVLLLGVLIVFELKTFFGAVSELLLLELLELLDDVLINWVNQVEDFIT